MQRIVEVVGELAELSFLINDLAQPGRRGFLRVGHLRTTAILLGRQLSLHIGVPPGDPAQRIRQALQVATLASFKLRDAAEPRTTTASCP